MATHSPGASRTQSRHQTAREIHKSDQASEARDVQKVEVGDTIITTARPAVSNLILGTILLKILPSDITSFY